MASLIRNLERFNRKERFYLLAWALGLVEMRDEKPLPTFTLGAEFRKSLNDLLGLRVPSQKVYVAMDYHIDWVYASLCLTRDGDAKAKYALDTDTISATPQDVDLLIAYQAGDVWPMIMLEAKGHSNLTNAQPASKARRLAAVFGGEGTNWRGIGVRPYFVMASSRGESTALRCDDWPNWMVGTDHRPYWLPMHMPEHLLRVARTDKESTDSWASWKITNAK